jgi:pyruvate kinase
VRTKENIQEVRSFLHENNADYVQIIAKIENQE